MNIKTGRQLGLGYFGTVYQSVLDGRPVICKIEKYDGDDTTTSNFVRQIKFNEFAKKHPDKFLSLVSYSVKEDCDFKQEIPEGFTASDKKKLIARNKWPLCSMLFYTPILDVTYTKIGPKLTDEQWVDCLLQTSKSVKIMAKAGYLHRDIHGGNLMARDLGGGKYQWYIIDYGLVWHESYLPNRSDEILKDRKYDVIGLAFTLVRNKAYDYYIKHELKLAKDADALKYIKTHERFELIRPLIPRVRNVEEMENLIFLFTIILDYSLYMEACGMEPNKKLISVQPNPQLLIKLLQSI
jgi:serine/threonine protein kinase